MGTIAERLGKPVSGADTRRRHASSRIPEEELKRFEEGWAKMMVTIFQEKLQLLGVYDTNYSSKESKRLSSSNSISTVNMLTMEQAVNLQMQAIQTKMAEHIRLISLTVWVEYTLQAA